jgi:putative hydrolase of the HAD superfamily
MPKRTDLALIFDADDTLWENNVYFEAAFDQFCEYLAHSSLSPVAVRSILDEIEIVNTQVHGYGSRNFARNLAQCYSRLAERPVSEEDLAAVQAFAHAILERPLELLPGVHDTIHELAGRHRLTLFTKGDPEEQQAKVERSGLAGCFEHIAIVKEKNEPAYRALAEERGYAPSQTWMIGNSPKSDINPALRAGLNAVFVPHARTWGLELDDVPIDHPNLLCVEHIAKLREHF